MLWTDLFDRVWLCFWSIQCLDYSCCWDPEMCPNSDLRLQMSILYGYLLKVDDNNREQAMDSLILACSFLDSQGKNLVIRGWYQFTIPTRGVSTCVFRKIQNVPPPTHFGIDTNPFWPIFKKKAYPPSSLYDTNRLLQNQFHKKKTYPPLKLTLNSTLFKLSAFKWYKKWVEL